MDRSQLNFLIDAFMFLCMMAIAGLGFLMKFVLIPGKERWAKYGRNVDLFMLDMDRHQWGTIHLIIAFLLLGALALHIYLHWNIIITIFRRLITHPKRRKTVAVVFLAICTILLILPLIVRPEVKALGSGQGHGEFGTWSQEEGFVTGHPQDTAGQDGQHRANHSVGAIEVRGQMTLGEVADRYSIPSEYLKSRLDIPESSPDQESLGILRKRYGFTMSDVEKIIEGYGKTD